MIAIETPEEPSRALQIARARGILPTTLDSRGLRSFNRDLRRASVFSARTANATYLQKIRDLIAQVVNGELGISQARAVLRHTLRTMGYTPEGGFPEDDARQVPPAMQNTIRDLSSNARLGLIVRTQEALVRNAAIKSKGLEDPRLNVFPAWEFVRVADRAEPREWKERWQKAGGPPLHQGRMIARKDDFGFWDQLGSSALFDDALDVDHPPFAFNSGMSWSEVDREEAVAAGLVTEEETLSVDPADADNLLPEPSSGTLGLDDDFIDQLSDDLDAYRAENGRLIPNS